MPQAKAVAAEPKKEEETRVQPKLFICHQTPTQHSLLFNDCSFFPPTFLCYLFLTFELSQQSHLRWKKTHQQQTRLLLRRLLKMKNTQPQQMGVMERRPPPDQI